MIDSSDDNNRPPLVFLHSIATPQKSAPMHFAFIKAVGGDISTPGLYHRPSLAGSNTYLSTISESESSTFKDYSVESTPTHKLNIPKSFSDAAAVRWKGVNIELTDDDDDEEDSEGEGWEDVELDWDSDDDDSDEDEVDPTARVTASPSKKILSFRNIFHRRPNNRRSVANRAA